MEKGMHRFLVNFMCSLYMTHGCQDPRPPRKVRGIGPCGPQLGVVQFVFERPQVFARVGCADIKLWSLPKCFRKERNINKICKNNVFIVRTINLFRLKTLVFIENYCSFKDLGCCIVFSLRKNNGFPLAMMDS